MGGTYVGITAPMPTEADRSRIEQAGGGRVPDAYWRLVRKHQGQTHDAALTVPGQGAVDFGVLLLVISPEIAGEDASYCVERCLENMREFYPTKLLSFADDTGSNYWAFDFRSDAARPSIVFIDHEVAGEEGVTPVSASLEALREPRRA